MIILGIETSCDETSIAILENEKIIVNKTYSQIEEHSSFGGVVPEIASRAHLEKIDKLAIACFTEAKINIEDIDLIAVTDGPGLAGALLIGISFGLGIHTARNIKITGINHLEGHIYSVFFDNPDIEFPFLALIVSGGHTSLYLVNSPFEYKCLGETVDDAAGEAFDKVGKLLGFSYPAGKEIEEEAKKFSGTSKELPSFSIARCSQGELFFSFSGLKTAVKYFINNKSPLEIKKVRPAICYSFQKTIVDSLVRNANKAAEKSGVNRIALVGGVACNSVLRERLEKEFSGKVYLPSKKFCTDNAAMIALAGFHRFTLDKIRKPHMRPSLPL
ncbi:MAG: tRNA (adenosine(37)-N6)-threonylcarbamoyltransferase complex transferase subunit TsaD [Chitinispirillaceae bacterium]|nr:tRNA (adenosine(37)-N6)-threonylcarbamoyltransferase complex transferase subunit TsaD [Chitinispirillaceae bacterium]